MFAEGVWERVTPRDGRLKRVYPWGDLTILDLLNWNPKIIKICFSTRSYRVGDVNVWMCSVVCQDWPVVLVWSSLIILVWCFFVLPVTVSFRIDSNFRFELSIDAYRFSKDNVNAGDKGGLCFPVFVRVAIIISMYEFKRFLLHNAGDGRHYLCWRQLDSSGVRFRSGGRSLSCSCRCWCVLFSCVIRIMLTAVIRQTRIMKKVAPSCSCRYVCVYFLVWLVSDFCVADNEGYICWHCFLRSHSRTFSEESEKTDCDLFYHS